MNGGCKNPPLAGESSITFDLLGPLFVLEINDLKGQAAQGPSLINPDLVQFKLKYDSSPLPFSCTLSGFHGKLFW